MRDTIAYALMLGCTAVPGGSGSGSSSTGADGGDTRGAASGPTTGATSDDPAGGTSLEGDASGSTLLEASTGAGSSSGPSAETSLGSTDSSSSTTGQRRVCFAEHAELFMETDCYTPIEGYEAWDCDVENLCGTVQAGSFDFVDQAQCLLAAIASGTVGRVAFVVPFGFGDYREGTIVLTGDGALLDLVVYEHCAGGGAQGIQPFQSGLLEIEPPSAACLAATDADELLDCTLGDAADLEAFPWLSGACLPEEAACP